MAKDRRIISNDDGWIMSNMTGPVTPQDIGELMGDTSSGAPIGAVSWCVGNSETYEYETQVGERTGEGYGHFEDERNHWLWENMHSLIESSGGPLTEIGRQFREAGIDFFPSMRMNSHYAIDFHSPRHGRFRREHPDWLIGQPHEVIPAPTLEYAIARGVDYKFPGVRDHLTAVIFELFERFDVDGIELDYYRHPAFFRIEEAYANRYLMTDFIRNIRRRMDEVGTERGKHLDLLVRVPNTVYDAKRIGLDVEVWIQEGLVDIVAAGGGFLPFDQPLRDFVEAAAHSECQILGSLEALRWALDEELLYAIAARHWNAGVDGFYLFNYFNAPGEWKKRVLGNMVDSRKLPGLNKRYELDHSDRVGGKDGHGGAFRYADPWASLPVFMEETRPGGGTALVIEVADDLEAAGADGVLGPCTLSLGFDNLNDDDKLDLRVNGTPLPWDGRTVSTTGWGFTVFDGAVYHTTMAEERVEGTLGAFAVDEKSLRSGRNELLVRLIKGASPHPHSSPVTLKEVRLEISYLPAD